MTKLTAPIIEKAVRDAFAAWQPKQRVVGSWEYICRVDPSRGFPQSSSIHTAFASALFGEVALLVREDGDAVVRVTYRGIPRLQQEPLFALITDRVPGTTLDRREFSALDFSLLAHRANTRAPHHLRLAAESEMQPISGDGTDPDELVRDLVKLMMLDAQYKLFIGRVNGGNEKVGARYIAKWERVSNVIRATLKYDGNRATETAAIIFETKMAGPWRVHVVTHLPGEEPAHSTFNVLDAEGVQEAPGIERRNP